MQAAVEPRDRAFCLGGDDDLAFSPNRRCTLGAGRSSRGYTITAGQEHSGGPSVFAPISRRPRLSRGK
jgi:hypothetical protein